MVKLQLNRGRINSTYTEDESSKVSPLVGGQTEAGLGRLGGLGEAITPFKGAQLNLNNVNALQSAY